MTIRGITLSALALSTFGLFSVAFAQSLPDIPTLQNAQQMDRDQRGNGVHYYYTSSVSGIELVKNYSQQLKSQGWTIRESGSHGDSWAGGAGLVATKGSAYLVLNAGGAGETHADLCVWPTEPEDNNC